MLGLNLNLDLVGRFGTGWRQIKRYITSLNAAGGMYYELSESRTLVGDFEFAFEFATSMSSKAVLLSTFTDDPSEYLNISINFFGSSGLLKIASLGQTPDEGSIVVNDGVMHECSLVFDSSTSLLSLYIDGSLDYSTTHANPSKLLGMFRHFIIGASKLSTGDGTGNLCTGDIMNFRLWVGGDRNTGTLVGDYPIDEDWTHGNVVRNRAAQLGGELAPSTATISMPSQYASVAIPNSGSLVAGKKYLYSMRVVSAPEGSACRLRSMGTSNNLYSSVGGRAYGIGTADAGSITLQGSIVGEYVIDELSVREIPSGYPYALAVNITEDEAEQFTKVDDGANWLGEERWAYGDVNFSTNDPAWAYKPSVDTSLTVGETYKGSFVLSNTSGDAGVDMVSGTINVSGGFKNEDGTYDGIFTASQTNNRMRKNGSPTIVTDVSNISVKRLIPIAQTNLVVV